MSCTVGERNCITRKNLSERQLSAGLQCEAVEEPVGSIRRKVQLMFLRMSYGKWRQRKFSWPASTTKTNFSCLWSSFCPATYPFWPVSDHRFASFCNRCSFFRHWKSKGISPDGLHLLRDSFHLAPAFGWCRWKCRRYRQKRLASRSISLKEKEKSTKAASF